MSTGFRLFLLILAVFAAVWLSKRSADDVAFWLHAPRAVQDELGKLESSLVDEVVPPIVAVELRTPQIRPRVPRQSVGPRRGARESLAAEVPELEQALEMTAEEPPEGLWLDPGYEGHWSEDDQAYFDGEGTPPGVEFVDGGGAPSAQPPAPAGDAVEPTPAPGPAPEPEPEPEPEPDTPRTYTVKKDDTLSGIAHELLGKASRYPEIQKLNADALRGAEFIREGMVLEIPAR